MTDGAHPRASLPLAATLEGRLVRRYKRFLAEVEVTRSDGDVPVGERLTVHCADPGSLRGLAREGVRVRCSTSDDPHRKLRYTLEMIRAGRTWVGVRPILANRLAELALDAGLVPALSGYSTRRREVTLPSPAARTARTRLDLVLEGPGRRAPAYVEVKSVTLARPPVARFPDSVTQRGRRHMDTLAAIARTGHRRRVAAGERAAVLFVVQRGDCERVEPADDVDPAYAAALRSAARRGVGVHAVRARVTPRAIRLERALPVVL